MRYVNRPVMHDAQYDFHLFHGGVPIGLPAPWKSTRLLSLCNLAFKKMALSGLSTQCSVVRDLWDAFLRQAKFRLSVVRSAVSQPRPLLVCNLLVERVAPWIPVCFLPRLPVAVLSGLRVPGSPAPSRLFPVCVFLLVAVSGLVSFFGCRAPTQEPASAGIPLPSSREVRVCPHPCSMTQERHGSYCLGFPSCLQRMALGTVLCLCGVIMPASNYKNDVHIFPQELVAKVAKLHLPAHVEG